MHGHRPAPKQLGCRNSIGASSRSWLRPNWHAAVITSVVAQLEAMVDAEPLRERRWAMLMLALYRCGRQAEALRAFQRARTALAEVGLEPGPDLASMERDVSLQIDRAIIDGGGREASSGAVGRSGNLPRPATELVGRASELQGWVAELELRRLVTLTGAGGVGKTRLAIEIAWSLIEDFSGGVAMVELAPVDDAAAVGTVASTLCVQPKRGLTMEQSIVESLRGRHILVLLDNCEHVLAPVTRLVEAIMSDCPTVTVLTTSREPLGILGEWVHVVAPLDPATEGAELFCDRAVAGDEGFTPSVDDRKSIMAICRHLDGMPLAIELAAARIRSSTPADVLSRLDDRFRLLRRSGCGSPPRHQTLRATVDWSYQLLDESERLLFDRFSVFAGCFDLATAEAVCADGIERPDIAGMVDSLVAKSMMTVERSRHGVRYRLLETLRLYGQERLGERGETPRYGAVSSGTTSSRGPSARVLASPRVEGHTILDDARRSVGSSARITDLGRRRAPDGSGYRRSTGQGGADIRPRSAHTLQFEDSPGVDRVDNATDICRGRGPRGYVGREQDQDVVPGRHVGRRSIGIERDA